MAWATGSVLSRGLRGTAAAHDEDDVDVRRGGDPTDRRGHLRRRLVALHQRRGDQNRRAGKASGDLEDIAHRGARRRGHETDPLRMIRDRALPLLVEEARGLEPLAQLLEGELERTGTTGLETAHDELKVASRRVDRDLRLDDDLEPLLEREACAARRPTEQRTADLPFFVLEREVGVARAGLVEVADLTDHEDAADALVQQPLEAADQLTDAELALFATTLAHRPDVARHARAPRVTTGAPGITAPRPLPPPRPSHRRRLPPPLFAHLPQILEVGPALQNLDGPSGLDVHRLHLSFAPSSVAGGSSSAACSCSRIRVGGALPPSRSVASCWVKWPWRSFSRRGGSSAVVAAGVAPLDDEVRLNADLLDRATRRRVVGGRRDSQAGAAVEVVDGLDGALAEGRHAEDERAVVV